MTNPAAPAAEVSNQAPPLQEINLFTHDLALQEAVQREGAGWAEQQLRDFGGLMGSAATIQLGFDANRHGPELRAFDRYGRRLDEVRYHPAYHQLMAIALGHGLHSIAWLANSGGHVAHTALEFLFGQIEQGVCCPVTMSYAAVPALRHQPAATDTWIRGLLANDYDPAYAPASQKRGLTMGMAMTEKQGGSDVRSNTTMAIPDGRGGPGGDYLLTGHKWFCSAPMSDAFLALARTDAGLGCFLVPRWRPDGSRNSIYIQRLKDKLGNRSNASAEIEFQATHGILLGADGRGVKTIIDMVHHTRLDAAMAPAGLMRQALIQAIHHARHRTVFGKLLIRHDLMQQVLADLALESEAATALVMRVARAFDEGSENPEAAAFARIAVAVAKYWVNKRAVNFVYEALEVLGGNGYVEESILPRLYREAPLNSIWEGSGNVICLDVLRALDNDPLCAEALITELSKAQGTNRYFDRTMARIKEQLAGSSHAPADARRLTELMAISLQAALLLQHAPAPVADSFCLTRLGRNWGYTYGSLPGGLPLKEILKRAWPV